MPRKAVIEGEVAKLPLGLNAKDGYVLVDKQFAYLDEYKWRLSTQGYVVGWVDHKDVRIHRLITGADAGMVVDHINHDLLDNRIANLRVCSQKDNMKNIKSSSVASSKYKGVSFYKRDQKFSSYIQVNGKKKHLGYFNNERDAALEYDIEAAKHFGEFAYLNFRKT